MGSLRNVTAQIEKGVVSLKQDLVFQRSRFTCGNDPYGRSSFDRTFKLADAAAHAFPKIHIGKLCQLLFAVRPGNHLFAEEYGLRRRRAMLLTYNAGAVSGPGKTSSPVNVCGTNYYGCFDLLFG